MSSDKNNTIELKLGDVIKIFDPTNETLDQQMFFIDYIDKAKIAVIDILTLNKEILKINDDKSIGDGSIQKISILNRAQYPGYAKQNGLVPNTWINIEFNGDIPFFITGQITNLEEDMIEITTEPEKDVLYINFEYKGIPEDLNIKNIQIREPPSVQPEKMLQELDIDTEVDGQRLLTERIEELDESTKQQLKKQIEGDIIKNVVREQVLRPNQIVFGKEYLGPVIDYVDVDSSKQRYSIEVQTSDLLDDLLSTIPSHKRTPSVLNNIHRIIQRYVELRDNFSSFDEYGNVDGAIFYRANYKPLINYFLNMNINLYWIIPVVKNIRILYLNTIEKLGNANDEDKKYIVEEFNKNLKNIDDVIDNYKSKDETREQINYSELYNDLNVFFTPFESITNEREMYKDIIYETTVKNNINTIMNNEGDFYSDVYNAKTSNNVSSTQYVNQMYNIGLKKLDLISSTSSTMNTKMVDMTEPDVLQLSSVLMLPEPVIRFSRINLPNTYLLDKINLNRVFFNNWQLFNNSTNINNINVNINDKTLSFEYNDENYAKNIDHFELEKIRERDEQLSKREMYMNFLETIIPKTKFLFNMMKKYIHGKLSIVDVVGYLEPYLIYTDNLTYMQYKTVVQFIDQKISEYNKNMENNKFVLSKFFRHKKNIGELKQNAFSLVNMPEYEIFNEYDFYDVKKELYTNSEFLVKIIESDYGRLYNSSISYQNLPLMLPDELRSLFEKDKKSLEDEIKKKKDDEQCKTIVIAKSYNSEETMKLDDGKDIYFDRIYDKTDYGLLDEYENEIMKRTPQDFYVFLVNKLKEKQKMNDKDAEYIAETLINGYKRVLDGHYAVLINEDMPIYFVRKNNSWVLDKTIDKNMVSDNIDLLCNLQNKCISKTQKVDNTCESLDINSLEIKQSVLKNVINEFDQKYNMSRADYDEKLKSIFEYYLNNTPKLIKIKNEQLLKYNNEKYKMGIRDENSDTKYIESPYLKIRDLILKQPDFVKRQNDIVLLVKIVAREAIVNAIDANNEVETPSWMYCKKTNTKFIPTFRYQMAETYLTGSPQNYNDYIEQLIATIGTLSDDGDKWIDKNSGWIIKNISLNEDEGYNEEGFKVTTRAVMEQDIGEKIISQATKISKYVTPEAKLIGNIIDTLSDAMGVNIQNEKDFIIGNVVFVLKTSMPNETDYDKKVKEMKVKDKALPSYKELFNNFILYNTFGMFIICVQTHIPSIRSKRTFPGCVRSFEGYPFDGTGNMDSINYLACIAYKIRGNVEPWNVLMRMKETTISTKIKDYMDKYLLVLPEIKLKMAEKTQYLFNNPDNTIPDELNVTKWLNFLPPLVPLKISNLTNVSTDFERNLLTDFKSGSPNQREKILVLETKNVLFSLAIQELIHNIVQNKTLLLRKMSNEPYVENACCNEKGENETTLQYFINENKNIENYNNIVNKITNVLADIEQYTKGQLFYSKTNLKNVYPPIRNEFDEETIYIGFIRFCHFNSLLPISDDLMALCMNKPSNIDYTESMSQIINNLKREGRNYNLESFLRLLQIVSQKNIVHIEYNNNQVSPITKFQSILKLFAEEAPNFQKELREKLEKAMDTFDIASERMNPETKILNQFLIIQNEKMRENIIDFINQNSTNTTRNKLQHMKNTINNLNKWNAYGSTRNEYIKNSNDAISNAICFFSNFLQNICVTYPNIILNKVNYSKKHVPNHWNLSSNHANEINKYISEHYELLTPFYNVEDLYVVLTKVQTFTKNIMYMAKNTPNYSTIKYKNKTYIPVFDENTSKYIFEYYLLTAFTNYIHLANNPNSVIQHEPLKRRIEVINGRIQEDLYASEYLNDLNNREEIIAPSERNVEIMQGNKKKLKQQVANLLLVYIQMLEQNKEAINISYEDVMDRVFKLKEREKNTITDKLEKMSNEMRDVDNILKQNKLGDWNKGLQKGLTKYNKEYFDAESGLRTDLNEYEQKLRKKGVTDDLEVEEQVDEFNRGLQIDAEEYDLRHVEGLDDFEDDDHYGVGADDVDYYEERD